MNRHALRLPTLTITLALLATGPLAGCGDDADGAVAPAEPGVVSISIRDFGYDDLPSSVPAGTRIEVSNQSDTELHEFVVFRPRRRRRAQCNRHHRERCRSSADRRATDGGADRPTGK